MGTLWGLVAGLGVFMVWWSFWAPDPSVRTPSTWHARLSDRLVQAGAGAVTPGALIATAMGVGVVTAILIAGLAGSPVVGIGFGVIAARGPFALVAARASRRAVEARRLWPDVVDSLASGVRAGLTLPEAVAQVGARGPEPLREPFLLFAEDYRASVRSGRVPVGPTVDGAGLLLAAPLLMTPGFVTDAIGFALLVPAVRRELARVLLRRMQRKIDRGEVRIVRR